jgi:hypothetical protein
MNRVTLTQQEAITLTNRANQINFDNILTPEESEILRVEGLV